MDKFLDKVHVFVQKNTGISTETDVLLVALSGGADSVCLLRVLQKLGFRCAAAHCNFHLRGDESDRDERFVRQLCDELGVRLHLVHFDTLAVAERQRQSLELTARRLRYEWFGEVMEENGYTALCVGHHRDDNVETLLLNLVRGSGIQGLCGMEPDRLSQEFGIRIVRPLLEVSREEIQSWLGGLGQAWVTDSTNMQNCAARNVVRNEVIPLLESINPAAAQNIQRTIMNLREVRAVYDTSLRQDIERCVSYLSCNPSCPHLIIDRRLLMQCASPITVLHAVLSPLGLNTTQVRNLLAAKGYRNNGVKGINPVRIPHTERWLNVNVGWERIEIRGMEDSGKE